MKYSDLKNILDKIEHLETELKNIRLSIDNFLSICTTELKNIKNLSDDFARLKHQLYINDYFQEAKNYISNYTDDEITSLSERFTVNSSSLFPGLYIGNEPKLAYSLVASDPLYIASWNKKVLHLTLKQFNEKYQSKLRSYHLQSENFPGLEDLPDNQFSSIVCWDIITFLSKQNANIFLNKLAKLLRPGGQLIFNFHNCDKSQQLIDAEKTLRPFQTLEDMNEICKIFDLCTYYNFNEHIDYIVVRKHGVLSTIKVQPVLGKIILESS